MILRPMLYSHGLPGCSVALHETGQVRVRGKCEVLIIILECQLIIQIIDMQHLPERFEWFYDYVT